MLTYAAAAALWLLSPCIAFAHPAALGRLYLRDGWKLQSSAHVTADGAALSAPAFRDAGWYSTTVPSTVLAALVRDKVYPDPYFAMNLRSIPGTSYPIGANFSYLEMPPDSPFRVPWWYRTTFRGPSGKGRHLWLHFDGITYRANVWLNGRLLAPSSQVAGTYCRYEFDITAWVRAENSLAVEVFPPRSDDLAMTWVDWNPAPPDKNMGLWRDVYLTESDPVIVRDLQVTSRLDASGAAHLAAYARLRNASMRAVHGVLRGVVGGQRFARALKLAPRQELEVTSPPLQVTHPRLWWPAQMGPQNLYDARVAFVANGQESDAQSTRFGIREITSEVVPDPHPGSDPRHGHDHDARIFRINGRRILIRGGGWAPDMLLRSNPARIEREMRLVRDLGLNTIRLEGHLESDAFFDLADRYGILVMAGWCCCDHWEHWNHHEDWDNGAIWKQEDYRIAARSLRDQIVRMRSHPSLLAWLNGSDYLPPPLVESAYLRILRQCHWPNPIVSSAAGWVSTLSGPSGVKMTGPYEWVPPAYWLTDQQHGGAFGFMTETSPGAAIPPSASLRRMLGPDHLWPVDDVWAFHAGGGPFKNLNPYSSIQAARYGPSNTVEDYSRKAQMMAYEGERAMFEAYTRNKYTRSGGVIQWMLNNAWPSMIWHLYDYYLQPGGGYFGTKKACEPVHIQYSYDDRSVMAVNSTYQPHRDLTATVRVLNADLTQAFQQTAAVSLSADEVRRILVIPDLPNLSSPYFVSLTLQDARGACLSSNFYWLSPGMESEHEGQFADFRSVANLPIPALPTSVRMHPDGSAAITIQNPTEHLAFFAHVKVTPSPALLSDNYITLLPGESRTLTACGCTATSLHVEIEP